MKFKSRINSVFTPEILDQMFDIYKQHKFFIKDKNGKDIRVEDTRHMRSLKFRECLQNYFKDKDISFNFLGDGTNRMALLIDGYVYKLALDDQGYIDNLTEFKMSREAQPYVTKTYETNGLFCVAEYVTLISYDEFVKQKMRILEILDILSSEYLLGDMGWTKKNYCNWGYRKNTKDLVILDYGHMMRVDTNKFICSECGGFLSYNSTFTEIECISCHKKMDFMAMKSKISKKEEMEMIDNYLDRSVSTTDSEVEIPDEKFEVVKDKDYDDVDEMVSTRFEEFKPKKKHRFSDCFDEDEKVKVNENKSEEDEYLEAMKNITNDAPVENQIEEVEEIPPRLKKIKDIRLRQLLMMEPDEAEYSLSQQLVTGEIQLSDYGYYMSKIEEYQNSSDEDDEQEELSTIGEIIESKKKVKEEIDEVEEDDEYIKDEDPEYDYMAMYHMLGGDDDEVVEEEVVEEVNEEETEIDKEVQELMHEMKYCDDKSGDLYPEDFIEQNASKLGFDEDDSEEDIEAYDRVLMNIKKGNNVDMDEIEDEIEEDVVDDIDQYESYVDKFALEVIEPKNEEKEQNVEPVETVEVKEEIVEEVKDEPNIIKVKRDTDEVKGDSSMKLSVKRKDDSMKMVVNEVNDKSSESVMEKMFKQMSSNENQE